MGVPMPLMPAEISVSISDHFTPFRTTKQETTVAESRRTMVVFRDSQSLPTMIVPSDRITATSELPKDSVFFSILCVSLLIICASFAPVSIIAVDFLI